jgi:hypothetical protein
MRTRPPLVDAEIAETPVGFIAEVATPVTLVGPG